MFNPNEIEATPLELEKSFKALELRIMQDIIRKLKENGGEITRASDWQVYRLYELGKCKEEIKQEIQKALKISDEEISNIYSEVFASGYARDKDLYVKTGKKFIPFEENKQLQQLISSVKKQTKEKIKNITQSLGFAVKQPDGKLKFKPIADFYQNTIDKGMLDITSGAFDYNTVLKRTVNEMTNSGLRTVDYASGWSNRVDVAARRAILTGFNQVVAKVNEDNAKNLETDTFEISWHSGHRPSHWWGGQWFEKEKLIDICGLGTVEGLCGCNCYHSYTPVIPGISVPTYSKEELEKMEKEEQEKEKYGNKEYTKYESLQRQRRLETTMRAQRQKIKLLQDGGADENDILTARGRYMTTSSEYVRFSKEMGLPQQRERVTIDGLNNIGQFPKEKMLKNAIGNDILKTNKTTLTGVPDVITQVKYKRGGISRNYYNKNGLLSKQISNNNHGNAKNHPFGNKGEHAHDYIYDKNGNLLNRPARELTDEERKENGDIL